MARKPTLHQSLPPVIGVDPGGASTAIVVRIGPELVNATVVTNPEPAKAEIGAHARNLSPEYGYLRAIRETIKYLVFKHDLAARRYWWELGEETAPGRTPFLLGIEKVNYPSLLPGKRVTEIEVGSVFAPKGIFEGISAWWSASEERTINVCPVHCDDRWEPRHGGTGNPYDYFPADLLAGLQRLPDGTFPSLDSPTLRALRVKDFCAAWSIASDAASDYQRTCRRLHGRELPPTAAPDVFDALLGDLRGFFERRTGGALPEPGIITLADLRNAA